MIRQTEKEDISTAGIKLLPYQESDLVTITALFYDTVHHINCRDYTKEQLAVWAPEEVDWERWRSSLAAHYTIVAKKNNQIVGFGDIDTEGYLDRLFVHKDFQRQGIATAILEHLESHARLNGINRIAADVSLTAKKFFLRQGYQVCKNQQVKRKNVIFNNFKMEKLLF